MRSLFLFLALTGAFVLSAGEVVFLNPELKLLGRRVRMKAAVPGAPAERVAELGYAASFILRNTGVNTVKLATGFNSIAFLPEPKGNLFVLKLSHRLVSVKLRPGDRFVIEYAPRNLRRYDFQEMKLRSGPMEFKFPPAARKVSPVAI